MSELEDIVLSQSHYSEQDKLDYKLRQDCVEFKRKFFRDPKRIYLGHKEVDIVRAFSAQLRPRIISKERDTVCGLEIFEVNAESHYEIT